MTIKYKNNQNRQSRGRCVINIKARFRQALCAAVLYRLQQSHGHSAARRCRLATSSLLSNYGSLIWTTLRRRTLRRLAELSEQKRKEFEMSANKEHRVVYSEQRKASSIAEIDKKAGANSVFKRTIIVSTVRKAGRISTFHRGCTEVARYQLGTATPTTRSRTVMLCALFRLRRNKPIQKTK